MKALKTIWLVFLTVWMGIQNIFGCFAWLWIKIWFGAKFNGVYFAVPKKSWGISLGWFIFIGDKMRDKHISFLHERGHLVQSKILGPLYMFTVGIGSWYNYATCKSRFDYHKFWCEKWADNISRIKRGKDAKGYPTAWVE